MTSSQRPPQSSWQLFVSPIIIINASRAVFLRAHFRVDTPIISAPTEWVLHLYDVSEQKGEGVKKSEIPPEFDAKQ